MKIEIIILLLFIPIIYSFIKIKCIKAKYHTLAIVDSFIIPFSILVILKFSFKAVLITMLLILSNLLISGILISKITFDKSKAQ